MSLCSPTLFLAEFQVPLFYLEIAVTVWAFENIVGKERKGKLSLAEMTNHENVTLVQFWLGSFQRCKRGL